VTVSSADFPIAFDVSKLSGDLHATFDKQPIIYMRKYQSNFEYHRLFIESQGHQLNYLRASLHPGIGWNSGADLDEWAEELIASKTDASVVSECSFSLGFGRARYVIVKSLTDSCARYNSVYGQAGGDNRLAGTDQVDVFLCVPRNAEITEATLRQVASAMVLVKR
jgi:hypothetical protein